jgi:hypothetical protein
MAFAQVRDMVAGAAGRLRSLKDGQAAIDAEIATVTTERRRSNDRETARLDRRLRDLNAQRSATDELLVEAERQCGDASVRLVEASKAAVANPPDISSALQAAAQRFDAAMAEGVASLAELEAAAGPIEHILMSTPMRRDATGWPAVNEAIQAGFQSRMGKLGDGRRLTTMAGKIAMVIDAAKQNAVRLKQRDYQL